MSKTGPILYVEDDDDDRVLFEHVIEDLGVKNKIHFFGDGQEVLEYLLTTGDKPFLILCDVNLPRMGGLELRDRIAADPFLKSKSVPFVFFSTAGNQNLVNAAFANTVQGYFTKPSTYSEMRKNLEKIFRYWEYCLTPL